MRALIVDDSKAMRSILKRILAELKIEAVEAINGKEALDRLKEIGKVELVLVDWNMPMMNGVDFVKTVRSDRTFDSVLLMMVTKETDLNQVKLALEAGANEYLMKPFTREMLLEKLQILGLNRT